jgi:hypothetical protein
LLSLNKEDFSVKVRSSKDKQKDVGVIYYKNNPIYVFIRNTSVGIKEKKDCDYSNNEQYGNLLISMIVKGQNKTASHNLLYHLLKENAGTWESPIIKVPSIFELYRDPCCKVGTMKVTETNNPNKGESQCDF